MKGLRPWRRQLASGVALLGAALLPTRRSSWASVMRAELDHIENDTDALRWSLGTLRAALYENMRAACLSKLLSAHAIGVVWISIFILSSTFNLSLTLAARLNHTRAADLLGSLLKDYRQDRVSALAEAMPPTLFAMMGLIVIAFSVSLYLNVRRRATAFWAFSGAVLLSLVVWLYQLAIPAYTEALSVQHRWRIGICFIMTAAILGALRHGSQQSDVPPRHLKPGAT